MSSGAADLKRSGGSEAGRWRRRVSIPALVLILGATVAWVVLMSSLPRIDGRLVVPGLEQSVTIQRDSLGVPAITARSSHDAYFALGWTHAQDRMWQMELQRRVGAGRLAEAVGEAGLVSDRFMRTLGLYRLAELSLAALDQPTRAALDAYADGVNAWLTEHRHRLPLEYTVLRLTPEPWRPADSMVWQKTMALQLAGNWQDDVLRGQLAGQLDPKRIQELFPAPPAEAPVTLTPDGGRALLDIVPEAARPTLASNIWVVAGSLTATGKPLLANDPHLAFRAPIPWYLASIDAPGLTLSGATVPGMPFHIIGHNRRIAWGFTSTGADTVDLFVEKLVGDGAYKTPGGSRPFTTREETIRVKGGGDVLLKIRETRHGPVISDLAAAGNLGGPGEVVAFSAVALGGADTGLQALLRLNLAGNWTAFVAALKDLQAPVLNIGYADTVGNIGFYTAGRLPIRKSGNGTLPARGWTGESDWTGWVPFAKLPQTLNPRSGLLINANNKVVGDSYPYLITATWPDGYRAQRIRDLLAPLRRMSLADMSAIQGDAVSLPAQEIKELLTTVEFKSAGARKAAHLVAEWDGTASRDRAEPLILAAWLDRLNRAIFADELGERFDSVRSLRPQRLIEALTRRRHWCDDVTTPEPESCDDLIERSLDEALKDLATTWGADMTRWKWGDAHRARFDNPILGRVPLLGRFANLDIASDGDDFTISRGSYRPDSSATGFSHDHGPGLRVVFDLADLNNSRFGIATGQSGHVLSRHYSDMLAAWRDNRLPWPTGDNASASAILTLTSKP